MRRTIDPQCSLPASSDNLAMQTGRRGVPNGRRFEPYAFFSLIPLTVSGSNKPNAGDVGVYRKIASTLLYTTLRFPCVPPVAVAKFNVLPGGT